MTDFRLKRKRQVTADVILHKFLKRFEEAVTIATEGKRQFNALMLNRTDQLRLYNLASWEENYTVELSYIIATLLEYYTRVRRGANLTASSRGLGIRVATLVGETSRKVIEQAVQKEYPQYENVSGKWHQKIAEELSTPVLAKRYDVEDASKFVASYQQRLRKSRSAFDAVIKDLRSKKFRGNTTETN
jgi:hypothetical protein